MAFQPQVNQTITINGTVYRIAEHPAAPGMPYGQEGRQATVYQVVTDGKYRALKVFKPRYRLPALVALADQLAPFADLPGLQVCKRLVLTPQRQSDLLRQYPDLTYAVLMPWVEGPTWMEVLLNKNDPTRYFTPAQSFILARRLAEILAAMEQRGIAHCDLSAPNLLLPALAQMTTDAHPPLALVDVEQLYGPGLSQPSVLPGGSAGYAHRTAPDGLWAAEADRFAGAVLIAELLGWCDERVRHAAWGESYFEPGEMQQDTERYKILVTVLRERWGNRSAELFEQAWHSEILAQCATFGEWLTALPERHEFVATSSPSPRESLVETLISQAQHLEAQGDRAGALQAYRTALAHLPEGRGLRAELLLIVQHLEKQHQAEEEIKRLVREAEWLAQRGQWQEAARAYQAALGQAPHSPHAAEWQAALRVCEEEFELARLFDGGVEALQRYEWKAAQELLKEVVRRKPDYERHGERAAKLLERAWKGERKPAGILQWVIKLGMAGTIVIAVAVMLLGSGANWSALIAALFATPTSTPTTTPTLLPPTPDVDATRFALGRTATLIVQEALINQTRTAVAERATQTALAPTRTATPTATPTPTFTATPTATPTSTATPTPIPALTYLGLRWEPAQPHRGQYVTFYARFGNTYQETKRVAWQVEVYRAENVNPVNPFFIVKAAQWEVPPGEHELRSESSWALRGSGNITIIVRATSLPDRIPFTTPSGQFDFVFTVLP